MAGVLPGLSDHGAWFQRLLKVLDELSDHGPACMELGPMIYPHDLCEWMFRTPEENSKWTVSSCLTSNFQLGQQCWDRDRNSSNVCLIDNDPFLPYQGRLLSISSFHASFFQVIDGVMQVVCQAHITKGVKRSNHGEIICCCKNPKGKPAWLQEGGWVLCVQVCDIQVAQWYTG